MTDAEVCGNQIPDEEAPAPKMLQRGNTTQAVDTIIKARNKSIIAGGVQALLGLVTLALDVVGVTVKADDANCDSKPLKWGDFYLTHAICIGIVFVINLVMLYA